MRKGWFVVAAVVALVASKRAEAQTWTIAPPDGESAVISASGFPPDCPFEAWAVLGYDSNLVSLGGASTDAGGAFAVNFRFPPAADTATEYLWRGFDSCQGLKFRGANPAGPYPRTVAFAPFAEPVATQSLTVEAPVSQAEQSLRGQGLPPDTPITLLVDFMVVGSFQASGAGTFSGAFIVGEGAPTFPRSIGLVVGELFLTGTEEEGRYPKIVRLDPFGSVLLEAPTQSRSAVIRGAGLPADCSAGTLEARGVDGSQILGGFGTTSDGTFDFSFGYPLSADDAVDIVWRGSGTCAGQELGGLSPGGPYPRTFLLGPVGPPPSPPATRPMLVIKEPTRRVQAIDGWGFTPLGFGLLTTPGVPPVLLLAEDSGFTRLNQAGALSPLPRTWMLDLGDTQHTFEEQPGPYPHVIDVTPELRLAFRAPEDTSGAPTSASGLPPNCFPGLLTGFDPDGTQFDVAFAPTSATGTFSFLETPVGRARAENAVAYQWAAYGACEPRVLRGPNPGGAYPRVVRLAEAAPSSVRPRLTISAPTLMAFRRFTSTGLEVPPGTLGTIMVGGVDAGVAVVRPDHSIRTAFDELRVPPPPREFRIFVDSTLFSGVQESAIYPATFALAPGGLATITTLPEAKQTTISGEGFPPGCLTSTLRAVRDGQAQTAIDEDPQFTSADGFWFNENFRDWALDATTIIWEGGPSCGGQVRIGINPGGKFPRRFLVSEHNTPAGAQVVSQPVDPVTHAAPATITFTTVTSAGDTVVTPATTAPPIPAGFQLGTPPVFYDITTSAAFTGSVAVCLFYPEAAFPDESQVRLLHFEAGAWSDRTTSLDVTANIVCGNVASFSLFAIVQKKPNHPPVANAGPDRTVACRSAAGAHVTLDGSASSDPDGDPLTFAWSGRFGTATGVSPAVSLPLGQSLVSLVVRDGEAASAPDVTSIAVALEPEGFLAPVNARLAPAGSPLVPPPEPFKAGRTLPLKMRLLCGSRSVRNVAAPRIVGLRRGTARLELHGPVFQRTGDLWAYDLSTRGLSRGTYVITIRLADGTEWEAAFVLR
jgi:hypothetical protein